MSKESHITVKQPTVAALPYKLLHSQTKGLFNGSFPNHFEGPENNCQHTPYTASKPVCYENKGKSVFC